jgi:MFS family permease
MPRLHLFGIAFLYTIQSAALSFFASPYLIQLGLKQNQVGMVYAAASICGVALLSVFPTLIRTCGARCMFVAGSGTLSLSLFLLALQPTMPLSLVLLLVTLLSSLLLWSVFDIGLEYTTKNENETGRTRSLFLSIVNIGFVAIPSVAGFLVASGGFVALFVFAGGSMLLCALYGLYAFPYVPPQEHTRVHIAEILDVLATQPNVRRVFSAQFLLQAFYSFMVIYMPIMLVDVYGLTLQEMSIVFSVAMVAFLVVEPPVGYISDMWLGEKEIMIGGFVILVVTTAALPLLAGASVLAWALLMFATRVGAASIEMTTESYFFKHVDSTNLVQVSAYRILSAAARIVVPLLGVFFLTFLPITYMPIALALCIALIASIELPGLVDTR